MAGIMANAASATMVSGDTSADNAVSGYVADEQISLSVTPTGSAYVWAISKPSGATSRSDLAADDTATSAFTPDTAGEWLVSLVVDSTTTYVLRISVTDTATGYVFEAMRFPPKTAASVATPATGGSVFMNSATSLLSIKRSTGTVRTLELKAYTPTSTADATGATGDQAFDDSYVYIKTSAGWKRAALASF